MLPSLYHFHIQAINKKTWRTNCISVPAHDADSQAGLTHWKDWPRLRDHPWRTACNALNRSPELAANSEPLPRMPYWRCSKPTPAVSHSSLAAASPPAAHAGSEWAMPAATTLCCLQHKSSRESQLIGPSPDLLLYEADRSLRQVTGIAESLVFQNTLLSLSQIWNCPSLSVSPFQSAPSWLPLRAPRQCLPVALLNAIIKPLMQALGKAAEPSYQREWRVRVVIPGLPLKTTTMLHVNC